ncbi:restriction endonuclease subunit S [Methylicorpusculum oleiharenae]|uniref:restriction endonuclease subunit S n=1 Tax=Methylicorpusculum oleiharenae TaxID=1338687 RepID=UPI001E4A32C9|nr:restriction endonuclease subunit S [Methylicorpusculum oleiharenae]MCD2451574.1 restriction endonuclease subunit S [Methylicorpusculum oleiharenae]
MNPEQLLQHFDRISEAPDAIPRLRRFILDLAVRGKLVEQDPNDEPAGELLKRIEAEKARLIKEGRIRKTKTLETLSHDDFKFKIPQNWIGSQLGNIYDVRDGTHDTPKYVNSGYPLVTSKNLSSGRLSFDDIKFISEQDHRQISERSLVEKDDILLAMIGSIGNPVIVDTDREFSIKNVALFKYYDRSTANPGFLCLYLWYAASKMQELAAGGLQPFVSLGFLRNYPIAVPPLPEQHRIVAKVDELMALCDRLESAQTEREQSRDRLVAASLNRLNPSDQSRRPGRDCRDPDFMDESDLGSLPPDSNPKQQNVSSMEGKQAYIPVNWIPAIPAGTTSFDEVRFVLENQPRLGANDGNELKFPLPPFSEQHRIVAKVDELMALCDRLQAAQTGREQCRDRLVAASLNRLNPSDQSRRPGRDCRDPDFMDESDLGSLPPDSNPKQQNVSSMEGKQAYIPVNWIPAIPAGTTSFDEVRFVLENQPRLDANDGNELKFPLPPFSEQHRIVAKVDELMALCDRLQAAQTEREQCRDRLVAASLNRLNQPDQSRRPGRDCRDPDFMDESDLGSLPPDSNPKQQNVSSMEGKQAYFPVNWIPAIPAGTTGFDDVGFVLENLPRLTTRPAHIKQLRQTILNLAVRGKLVAQDQDEESADELLKKVEKEIDDQQFNGFYRKTKPLPSVRIDEKLFTLPFNWEWSRLRSLAHILGDGIHGTPTYTEGTGYYFINGNNLVDGKIVIKPSTKTVSFEEMQKYKKPMTTNTVLVSINGTLGNVAFYHNEEVVLGKSACYFNLSSLINKYYIKLIIESPYFIDYALHGATGATIKNLSLKAMNEFPVPLPPLPEQHRIVAKVDELMALCDQLETQLTRTAADSRRLLESLLHEALVPASEQAA